VTRAEIVAALQDVERVLDDRIIVTRVLVNPDGTYKRIVRTTFVRQGEEKKRG
jgi:hypothetical protein